MAEIPSSMVLLFKLTATLTVTGTPRGLEIRTTSVALSHNFIPSSRVSVFITLINNQVEQYDMAWLF